MSPNAISCARCWTGARAWSQIQPGIGRQADAPENTKRARFRKSSKIYKKRCLQLMRIYDVIWNPKVRLLMPSCTGSATRSVLNLDILFSAGWKNRNVNFPKWPITFRRPRLSGLSGAYFLRRKVNDQGWPKDSRQRKAFLRAMRIPYV